MSSDIQQLFKLLLKKDFWEQHRHQLPVQALDAIAQDVLPSVEKAHETVQQDLSPKEVLLTYLALHPAATTAAKNTVEAYLHNLENVEDINEGIGALVFKTMWRKEVGRRIAEYGYHLIEGDKKDLDGLHTIINNVGGDFVPSNNSTRVDSNPIDLFKRLNEQGKWKLNIPHLDSRVRNISGGNFIVLLARPESGKTATVINLIAGKQGFAAQGANVHLLANEEGAHVTAGRSACCFNEIPFSDALSNSGLVNTDEWNRVRNNITFLHQPEMTLAGLDLYCKQNKPEVLIIDQLDHLGAGSDYARGDERLGAIYRRFRELASIHNFVGIGVSQASAEAEGRTRVTFAMSEGSKTSKAAAADLIIGVGKANEDTMEEQNEVLRHFTVSKNKISGWKGTIVCKLVQDQSRFIP